MAVAKIDPKVIFASEAPAQDTPAVFTNKTVGWGESRKNGGRPTIKQSNALQQETDLKILWLNENSVTPFDATIDYPENAVTLKDDVFKILKLGVWEVFLDKSSVGLINVDNTSDLNKPVSTATQTALNLKADKSATYTKVEVDNAIDLLRPPYLSSDVVDGNQTQDQINLYGGKKYDMPVGGYLENERVVLTNGDIVKSTVDGNVNNPNVDMVGWIPVSGVLTFDMFGIDNTGTVAVDSEIRRVAEISTALKLPIHQFSGNYLLNGSSDITFTENTLLDGSKFILGASFAGRIICKRNDEVRGEITSGALFDQVKEVGTLYKGQTFLAPLTGNYQDYYMTLETTQPMYYYRSVLENAFLKTRHYREGRLQSGPFFNLDLTKLTKIRVAKANDSIRLFSGFCFDESGAGALLDYFKVIDSNMVAVNNIRYVNRGPERDSNQTRFTLENCYNVRIDGIDTSSPHANPNGTYTYTMTLSDSYDVYVKNMYSQGRGWGTVGNNNCGLVTFENCDVNRIDFHRACYEKFVVKNCRIGDFGIIATLVADLYITDTQFLMSQGYGNRGYIRSSSDASGFCNGDLFINNVTINGYLANGATFIHARHGLETIPAGSPLVQEMFTNVYIDGLRHNGSASANITSLFSSDYTGAPINMLPKRIYVTNCSADLPTTMFDIHVDKFALRSTGVDIIYNNVATNTLSFRDTGNIGTKGRVKLTNIAGQGSGLNTIVNNTANFNILASNCQLGQYTEYIGSYTTFAPKVTLNGGSMINGADVAPFLTASGVHNSRIKAINVDFSFPTLTYLPLLFRYQPVSCWFNGIRYMPRFESAGAATGNFAIDTRSGMLRLLLEHDTLRYETTVSPAAAGTYTTPNGASIVVTVSGTTATITVNVANLKLIGLLGIV